MVKYAIVTKYLGPTDERGPRVKATSASGPSITIPWDSASSDDMNHRLAATALCGKLKWDATAMIQGALKSGRVFVFPE